MNIIIVNIIRARRSSSSSRSLSTLTKAIAQKPITKKKKNDDWESVSLGEDGDDALRTLRRVFDSPPGAPAPIAAFDDHTYASLLRFCGSACALDYGKQLDAHMAPLGRARLNPLLGNLLVQMYGKCGDPGSARVAFDSLPRRTDFSWNVMIAAYAYNGRCEDALALYRRMLAESSAPPPGKFTFLPALVASAGLASLQDGKRIHERILATRGNLLSDVAIQTALVTMYAKCGSLRDARSVFDSSRPDNRDRVLWNAMISSYAHYGHTQEAFLLVQQMLNEGFLPDNAILLCLLSSCSNRASLHHVRDIHKWVLNSIVEPDIKLNNGFLSMYGKCGGIPEARDIFEKMGSRDTASWNSMLSAYAQNGYSKEALQLYKQMNLREIKPGKAAYLGLLNACANTGVLELGRSIHQSILASELSADISLMTTALNMYGRCGSVEEAESVFHSMAHRDTAAWNAMLSSYARNGCFKATLALFRRMSLEGAKPDRGVILCIVNACATLSSLDDGKEVHKYITDNGYEADVAIRTALLSMYARCGGLANAEAVFEGMCYRDMVAWNAMLTAYAQTGHIKQAIELLSRMDLEEGIKPDRVSFLCLLSASDLLETGRAIHKRILGSRFESDVTVQTALLSMYGRCGSLEDARSVFDDMCDRDVISWSAMLTVYAESGRGKEALELFRQMDLEAVKPDKIIFLCLLNTCAGLASLEDGRAIHECMVACGFERDVTLKTALVNMYGKCGNVKQARLIFDGMDERDIIAWSSMLTAYAQNGYGKEALALFHQMEVEGIKPDKVIFLGALNACASVGSLEDGKAIHERVVGSELEADIAVNNALLSMYGKCGSPAAARAIFDGMRHRDVISWNAMLTTYFQNGSDNDSLKLFKKMDQEGVKPDKVTFLSLLNACTSLASLDHGRAIHKYVSANGLDSDYAVQTALLNLYGKAGSLEEAQLLFDKMGCRDVVSWNAMLTAYAQNGYGKEALKLFEQMCFEAVKPDKVSLRSLLTACSHTGLPDEGWGYIITMIDIFNMTLSQDHYICMIDLLGRSGFVKEAKDTARNMPVHTDNVTWKALLAGFRISSDTELGLDMKNHEPHVSRTSINANHGRDNVQEWRQIMEERGANDLMECG